MSDAVIGMKSSGINPETINLARKPVPRYQRQTIRQTLGENIRMLRMEMSMGDEHKSIYKLSKATGVSMVTIIALESAWHTDEKRVTLETLHKIARPFLREIVVEIGGEEISCGATTPVEELVSAGAEITFVSEG